MIRSAYLATLLATAVFTASNLDARLHGQAQASLSTDPLEAILGSSREMIGDTMFIKADEYLHGGVTEKFEEHEGSDTEQGHIAGRGDARSESDSPDWIAKINSLVKSHEHFHLSGDKRKEMLPFFALSTSLDPHNVEAILATAYWLETEFQKTDDAIGVLQKGITDNPDAWQIEDGLASVYFRKKDYVRCEAHYLQALHKAAGKELQYFEWSKIYYHLAETQRFLSKDTEALSNYQKALAQLRGRGLELEKTIRAKIGELDRS